MRSSGGLQAGLLLQNQVALPQPVDGASVAAHGVQEPAGIYRVTRKRVRRLISLRMRRVI